MGVNCRITLPPAARVDDVANVIGRLSGAKAIWKELDGSGGWYCKVEQVTVKPSSVPECADIQWTGADGVFQYVMYHFEWDEKGNRGLLPTSTAFWVAAACRLVDFFGGQVDYNDSDGQMCDYSRRQQPGIHANDGEEWDQLQEKIMAVKPLTGADLKAAAAVAAY